MLGLLLKNCRHLEPFEGSGWLWFIQLPDHTLAFLAAMAGL
jgi:hypothetical protein